ncbi:MAG: hypothetical protein HMLKMBBP_03863 [Planctomycetes bacterium]|nr:hypothetical protein [Planctomycetota bacterium]
MTAAVRRRGRPVDPELRARREAQILDAAATAFALHGFTKLDVEVLAAEIGVGKGTVYRYFPTKEELFLAALDRLMRVLTERVREEAGRAEGPLERVVAGVRAYLAHFDEHAEHVELLVLERAVFRDRRKPTYFRHREQNLKPWEELFRELIAAGVIRDVPVERIVEVLSHALYGTIFTNHFTGRRRTFEAQAADLLDVVFWGIREGDRPVSGRRKS